MTNNTHLRVEISDTKAVTRRKQHDACTTHPVHGLEAPDDEAPYAPSEGEEQRVQQVLEDLPEVVGQVAVVVEVLADRLDDDAEEDDGDDAGAPREDLRGEEGQVTGGGRGRTGVRMTRGRTLRSRQRSLESLAKKTKQNSRGGDRRDDLDHGVLPGQAALELVQDDQQDEREGDPDGHPSKRQLEKHLEPLCPAAAFEETRGMNWRCNK